MNYDNALAVLIQYTSYLKIRVNQNSIETALKTHAYPSSLLAINDALNNWNVPNEAFSISAETINKIPTAFIAVLSSNNGELVFVEPCDNGRFMLSNKILSRLSISNNEFKEFFAGQVLIAEADEHAGEPDYDQKHEEILKAQSLNAPRLKPSFLVIGAQKAGTTAFYEYLNFHPGFRSSSKKEVHFFNLNYNKGISWYHDHFPSMINENNFTGEASPCYLFHPSAPERVFNYSPDIKLICLLRDPIERAYSHYWMNVQQGWERLNFEDAIALENERTGVELEKIKKSVDYNSFNCQKFSYILRGKYSEQIKLWLKFFKREQFLFINATTLKHHPEKVFDDFCQLINVDLFKPKKNIGSNSRSYEKMHTSTHKELQALFEPYNTELAKITGINFNK